MRGELSLSIGSPAAGDRGVSRCAVRVHCRKKLPRRANVTLATPALRTLDRQEAPTSQPRPNLHFFNLPQAGSTQFAQHQLVIATSSLPSVRHKRAAETWTDFPQITQMPKIKSFAPSWLNEPAPGHKLFELSNDDVNFPASLLYGRKPRPGPRRTIARRGTEVFVAVGKQIRWGDLAYLKESWEAKSSTGVHVKTESADDSFEIYDETAPGNGHVEDLAEGYRVSASPVGTILVPFSVANSLGNRLSRRLSPTTSASSSCPQTGISWPF